MSFTVPTPPRRRTQIARRIGTSWDLDGHRYPTDNPLTWAPTG